MLTPLTTLALNTARANLGTTGILDAAAYQAAVAQWLAAFNLPANLNINTTAPTLAGSINAYGQALITISRMLGSNLTLAQLLAAFNPAALQAAL